MIRNISAKGDDMRHRVRAEIEAFRIPYDSGMSVTTTECCPGGRSVRCALCGARPRQTNKIKRSTLGRKTIDRERTRWLNSLGDGISKVDDALRAGEMDAFCLFACLEDRMPLMTSLRYLSE